MQANGMRRAFGCLYHRSHIVCSRRSIGTHAHFGQPLHETHPHLIKSGELTPGITALEYHERRSRLAQSLPVNSIAVLAAADLKYKSGAVFHEFHQDTDFFYLTGFNEPGSLAVIEKTTEDYRFHLFVRPKDTHAESWDGTRTGIEAAKEVFNADEAGSIDNIHAILPDMLCSRKEIFTNLHTETNMSPFQRLMGNRSSQTSGLQEIAPEASIRSLRPFMNELRVKKSAAEVAVMRHVGQVSARVLTDAMRRSFTSERQLWNHLEHEYRDRGLDGSAYLPVVAGGQNGLMIHYVRNDHLFGSNETVLVDSAGQYGYYNSDITRVFPTTTKSFTSAQRDLYQVVLDVQKTCVALCRQDANMSLDDIHRIGERGLSDGLTRLGFDMGGSAGSRSATGGDRWAIQTLFPHHIGHHLGLDLHDLPGFSKTAKLKHGYCVTIEPGVYVPVDDRWPKQFQGMAVRIEDSVAVTEEHPFVLTTEAVKEVVDIEALKE